MKRLFLQKYLLLASDLFSLTFTYWLSIQIANVLEPARLHRFDTDHLVLVKALNALVILAMFWIAELYVKRRPTWEELRIIYKQIIYILILDFVVISLSRSEHVTYLFFFMYWALLFVILPLFRTFTIRILLHYKLWQRRVYIVGTGDTALSAYSLLKNRRLMGFQIHGFVDINRERITSEKLSVAFENKDFPLLGLKDLLDKNKTCEVVVALDSLEMVRNIDKIFLMQRNFMFVSIVPDFDGLPLYGIEINHFFGNEQLMLRLENNLNRRLNRLVKMFFDYGVVLLCLPVVLPLMLLIGFLIFLEDRGNPFFIQPRLGYDGRTFGCIKFRSMHKNAEKMLNSWREENNEIYQRYVANNFKLDNDPRVTRIGRLLRKTSLDELGQLLNVLKGEMSLVGPRPLLARELSDYNDGIFYYAMVKPGITGMWQVSGRSKTSFADRCRLDTWYIKNWSLWYDVVILIKTIGVVLKRDGAY